MYTAAAARSIPREVDTVVSTHVLLRLGWTPDQMHGQVRARRWQQVGRAIVLHNAAPSPAEMMQAALISQGPAAALTAFSALQCWGLKGWERDRVHLLLPRGARVARPKAVPLRIHFSRVWKPLAVSPSRRLHRPAPAALRAAATFSDPRPAAGILAAVVQQRLAPAAAIAAEVTQSIRVRHRAVLLAAARDMEQGAQALSELDLGRLCRRHGLPEPTRQAVRVEPSGRRRYLDAEWLRPDGRRLVVEVDGALHLAVRKWWDDQLRQNWLVLGNDVVLRFPSLLVRVEHPEVVEQLARGLLL